MAKGYFAPSVKRAFEILRMISRSREGLGISELARTLNMAKSTVHGMTSALEEAGAVMRNPVTKRYTLGFTLFELGRTAYLQIDLKSLSRPVMESLMEKTGTSVFLGLLNGEHVTILDVVESKSELKITAPIGAAIPLIAGAVGKVMLSRMDEEQARKLVGKKGLMRYTENTISDTEAYFDEIRAVRKKGYATDDEEYIAGVRAVASPILEESDLMGALWAVGFKASLDGDKMKSLISETRKAADAINRRVRGDMTVSGNGR
ncbi:MAG: IclR family transcriptional regulator [Desulfobacteraceae bacterium]|nr:MAG: IclR family transcriptional regulator [Desulfobacteraceae bacterium]